MALRICALHQEARGQVEIESLCEERHNNRLQRTALCAAAEPERHSGYVILTNSDNGWKVFYDKQFVAAIDRILLG